MKKEKQEVESLISIELNEKIFKNYIKDYLLEKLNDGKINSMLLESLCEHQVPFVASYIKRNIDDKFKYGLQELMDEALIYCSRALNHNENIYDIGLIRSMEIKKSVREKEIKQIQELSFKTIKARLEKFGLKVTKKGKEVKYETQDLNFAMNAVEALEGIIVEYTDKYKSIKYFDSEINTFSSVEQNIIKLIHTNQKDRNNKLYLACLYFLSQVKIKGMTARSLEERIRKYKNEEKNLEKAE